MNRRKFLIMTGLSLPISLTGGCVATGPEGLAQSNPSKNDAADESSPMVKPRGPVRGKSDVELTVRDVEDDENVTYLAATNHVEYVAGWRHTNHEEVAEGEPPKREPFFETTPFERWGETQCLSAAARAAVDHVNETLDTDEVGGGITSTVDGEDRTAVISVSTTLDRDGKVVHETNVDFEALVAATPATVKATYVLGEREYELAVPMYARYSVSQYD